MAVVAALQLSTVAPGRPSIEAETDAALAGGQTTDLLPVTDIVTLGAVDTSDVDRRILFWQTRANASPRSENAWIYLGELFDLKGRITGDVSHFAAAQQAFASALEIAPASAAAHSGQARVLTTLHQFDAALAEATLALDLAPNDNAALSIVFDASIELGELDNARRALDILAERSDAPSVLTRRARLAFLTGDTAAAVAFSAQAADDSRSRDDLPSSTAFYDYSAAEYQLLAGALDQAGAAYDRALNQIPAYPLAIYGQARIAYAEHDLERALALAEAAASALPRPDMVAFLGDLYALSGRPYDAADQYATVDFIAGVATSETGPLYDREYALFLADHGRDAGRALALAEAELEQRQDVHGYDALAWALHANGRSAEALAAIEQALALGTADPRLLMHAGLIELANGLESQGRAHLETALRLGPAGSPLVIETAREALAP